MSDLVAPIKDGKLEKTNSSSETTKKRNDELGKEEFLQLLVAQMKYQDPLNPASDTEFISQLAQFSSLEQMQNLNLTTMNTQAFSLVGKQVIMSVEDSSGNQKLVQGAVDYVTMKGSKTFLSIEDKLYSIDDLYSVVDDYYIASEKGPKVPHTSLKYDHQEPKDIELKITLGEDEYKASQVAVVINGNVIDAKYLDYEKASGAEDDPNKDIVLKISKEAFSTLDAGTYNIAFVFNDPLQTAVGDKVSITVTGIKPEVPEEEKPEGGGNTDDSGKEENKTS